MIPVKATGQAGVFMMQYDLHLTPLASYQFPPHCVVGCRAWEVSTRTDLLLPLTGVRITQGSDT